MNLVDEVVAASARPKRAFEWILEVQSPGALYEQFENAGEDMVTLDAKLSSALAHIAPAEFQRTLHTKKLDAMKEGKMIAGRQILFLIDQHYRMSEMDGGVYDTEHLFSVKMKGERLQEFVTTWDQVLAGLAKEPDSSTLQALLLRSLRHCKAMEQDIAYYDRMLPSDPDKSYDYLMRCARAVVERNRLHWYRDELSRSIGGGWVNPVGKGKGKSSEKASKGNKKGKSAGKGGFGAHKAARNSSRERSPSPDSEKGSENDRQSSPKKRDKDLCRAHLTGKGKAGENCV